MIRMNKNLPWVNLTFVDDVLVQFVSSDEDGVLVGRVSFQEKKIAALPLGNVKPNSNSDPFVVGLRSIGCCSNGWGYPFRKMLTRSNGWSYLFGKKMFSRSNGCFYLFEKKYSSI